jgi:hypothetical protein
VEPSGLTNSTSLRRAAGSIVTNDIGAEHANFGHAVSVGQVRLLGLEDVFDLGECLHIAYYTSLSAAKATANISARNWWAEFNSSSYMARVPRWIERALVEDRRPNILLHTTRSCDILVIGPSPPPTTLLQEPA